MRLQAAERKRRARQRGDADSTPARTHSGGAARVARPVQPRADDRRRHERTAPPLSCACFAPARTHMALALLGPRAYGSAVRARAPQPPPELGSVAARRSPTARARASRASLVCSASGSSLEVRARRAAAASPRTTHVRAHRAHPGAPQAQLSAAKDKIASQQSEIERLGTDLAAALDNVVAARAAAASLDAQRAAAVKSVTKALADKRNEAMAHADAIDALQARVAELEAQLGTK